MPHADPAVRRAWQQRYSKIYREKHAAARAEYQRQHRAANPTLVTEQAARQRKKNPEGALAATRRYAAAHPDKVRAMNLRVAKRGVDGLADRYIRQLLAQSLGVSRALVPPELIEAHRALLKVKRLIREKSQ